MLEKEDVYESLRLLKEVFKDQELKEAKNQEFLDS